jgi:hypothetical protein
MADVSGALQDNVIDLIINIITLVAGIAQDIAIATLQHFVDYLVNTASVALLVTIILGLTIYILGKKGGFPQGSIFK